MSQGDNNKHSASITTWALTNFTLPDKLDPNGTGVMPSQGLYNPVNLAPTSLASAMQSPYDPNTAPSGTAPYTHYDTYGRVDYTLAPSQAFGSQNGARTDYTYSYTVPWTTTATTTGTSGTHWVKKTLDGLGRAATVQTGTGSTTITEVDTNYAPCACSPVGKMSQQSEPYPGAGTVVYTSYTYQTIGLTNTITLADGSVTAYTYWGNATLVVDAANKWKLYFNDAFGNLVSVIEPDPAVNPAPPSAPPSYPVSTAPANTLLTSYTYDLLNHLTQVSMPRMVSGTMRTQTRTFNYDSTTQRLTSTVNPENGTIQYTYNNDGTPSSKVFNSGNKETYEYDTYQRLVKIHRFPGGTYEDANQLQTLTYDILLTTATFAAKVGSNYKLTFQNQYTYTPAGNIASKTLYMTSGNHNSGSPLYVPASGMLTANYTYDSQGVLTSTSYPRLPASPLTLTYALDAMERPTGLTDQNSYAWVSGVTYNAANQLLTATFPSGAETWVYNNLFQLTQRTTGGGVMNMTYNYTAGANNGQITSSNDAISGETITYQYDALKRLLSASSTSGWSETYANDGFGNLTGMTGTGGAPNLSVGVDWATNRITPTGVQYDGNGNVTAMLGTSSMGYDVANRMVSVSTTSSYAYDGGNRRVYANVSGTETIYLYGAGGEKLAAYAISGVVSNTIQFSGLSQNVYFAGRLVSAEGSGVAVDRLGSVRARTGYPSSNSTYYPYGVEYSTTGNDTEKYATYTRDNLTGLDYAVNRYYASIWGRFLSPDAYANSAGPEEPGSWNRYAYALGDPVNLFDPHGTDACDPDHPWECFCWDTGYGYEGGYVPDTTCLGVGHSTSFLPAWFLGGGGGGGGNNLLSASKKRVQDDLSKPNCAKDFKNANKDISKAATVSYKDLGEPTFESVPGGPPVATGGDLGEYTMLGRIFLNSEINWQDPNNTPDLIDGKSGTYQALAAEAAYIGVPSLTSPQFMDLVVLHELSHYNGAIGNPDKGPSVEEQLYEDCIK